VRRPLRPTNATSTRGKNSTPHHDPRDPLCRRANQRKGHETYEHDRPPIISIISRDMDEQRWWVCDHADTRTCTALIAENLPPNGTRLSTDK